MGLSRRGFLAVSGAVGGSLVLGIDLRAATTEYPNTIAGGFQPNAWLQVTSDNRIVLQIHKAEMGQGILTGLATLVAEELDIDPRRLEIEFSGVHPEFINPQFDMQITNASSSMITCYLPVREAAAAARSMLMQAAAEAWGVAPATLRMKDAMIFNGDSNRQAPLGEFVALANTLPVPEQVTLKDARDFEYIGRFEQRLDSKTKITGTAPYGIDATVPGAASAVVVRSPHFGGSVKSFDAAGARSSAGVIDVFLTDQGIAVVAESYWQARQAAERLQVEWDPGAVRGVSSASIAQQQDVLLSAAAAEDAPLAGDQVLNVEYTAPLQAHVCMEPLNATVAIGSKQVDVWIGNQAIDVVQAAVAEALDRPRAQVTVHQTFMGGGFGRRVYPDAAVEAAVIANHVGRPIKLTWSREDDLHHDAYRPAVKCRMSAMMEDGAVKQWRYRICGPSHWQTLIPGISALQMPGERREVVAAIAAQEAQANDRENLEGAQDTPYRLGTMKVDQILFAPGIPVSFWRSVGHSFNAFFVDGFIDEMAYAGGIDPVTFRLNHLAEGSRERRALARAADAANWGKTTADVVQGVTLDTIKGTTVAMIADVRVHERSIQVDRILCAVDCGVVVNPGIARSQVESCIVYGLTAALKGKITIENGAVQQSNFHDYPMVRINETPVMEVHLIESNHPPSGVGECAVAPVAPAIANAVFRATGQRLRSLPLRLA